METRRLRVAALFLLAPAPLLFAVGAMLRQTSGEPTHFGILLAIGGVLSLIGLLLAVWAWWEDPQRNLVATGVALALIGHFLVSRYHQDVGASITYLGTGAVGAATYRLCFGAGVVAGAGALVRMGGSEWLLIVGAAALGATLVVAGFRQWRA